MEKRSPKLILIFLFGAQETFIIIISVKNSCLICFMETLIHFKSPWLFDE